MNYENEIEKLIEIFISDNKLINYIKKEIKTNFKITNINEKIIIKIINKVFNDLKLEEIIEIYLNEIYLKGRNLPEYSESEPIQSSSYPLKKKLKDKKNIENYYLDNKQNENENKKDKEKEKEKEKEKDIIINTSNSTTTFTNSKLDLNKTQRFDPNLLSINQLENSFNSQNDLITSPQSQKLQEPQQSIKMKHNSNDYNQKEKIDKILWVEVPEKNDTFNNQPISQPEKLPEHENQNNNSKKTKYIEEEQEESEEELHHHQQQQSVIGEEEEEEEEESQNSNYNDNYNDSNDDVIIDIKRNDKNNFIEIEKEDDHSVENNQTQNNNNSKDDSSNFEHENDYSMSDFETSMNSPEKSLTKIISQKENNNTDNNDQNNNNNNNSDNSIVNNNNNDNNNTDNNAPIKPKKRQVNFVEGFVSDMFVHREKHTPEEVSQLFYTQNEAMRFQYDYDREAQRADNEGVDWLKWMMNRSEEDRIRHEQEDESEQYMNQDYWEDNDQYDQYEEESQSGEDMW